MPALREVAPQLATLVERAPLDAGWLYETKYDGYRILARVQNGQVELVTRNGHDFGARAPNVVAALERLSSDGLVLDGELISPGARAAGRAGGAGDFQALQNALHDGGGRRLVYVVFDCLFLSGLDLRGQPLVTRKAALARALAGAGPALKLSRHVTGSGAEILAHACELGFEGVIAKRAASPYRPGRGRDWLKLKCTGREEFVIVGFTPPAGARAYLGALLLATRQQSGAPLAYAGKVGTGFSAESLRALSRALRPLRRATAACERAPRGHEAKDVCWVEPRLVAEVSFSELTADGRLRHPSFQGLREDKDANAVVRERLPRKPR